jgi:hypothetical protein
MMKINYVALTLVLIAPFLLRAQKDETRFIKNSKETNYSFDDIRYLSGIRLPFKQIMVLDKRFDTTKTGYTYDNISNKYSKIVLQKNWSEILNEYFRDNLDTNSHQTLLIVIQAFWMQFGTLAEVQRLKKINEVYKEDKDRGGSCMAEIDVFVQSDSIFQALFKIDTTFLSLSGYNRNKLDNFFFLPFDSMAIKINSLPISQSILNKRKIKLEEINSVYNNRFQIPILKHPIVEKGVFLSFQEFKENKPAFTQFILKKGDLTDELYIVNNGKEDIVEKYWGFVDSSGLYIHLGANAFKAIRQQNTYELVGFQHINITRNYQTGSLMPEALLEKRLASKTRKIFQVNMRTGRLH